jgi:hypothetical protein
MLKLSQELRAKLAAVGDFPIMDSRPGANNDGTRYEVVQGQQGTYLSSEADGWKLRGPFRRSALAPAPAPKPSLHGLSVDASNYTGAFTNQMMLDLQNAGVISIIIQAVTGRDGKSFTRQQLDMASRHGFSLMGYVFPDGLESKLPMYDGYQLLALWLDVELPITRAGVDAALAQCDSYFGARTGIYTGKWFFDQQGWSQQSYWADRDLWDSNYDGIAVVGADFRPYGGWDHRVIKQYAGTSSIGSVHQIDLDVA